MCSLLVFVVSVCDYVTMQSLCDVSMYKRMCGVFVVFVAFVCIYDVCVVCVVCVFISVSVVSV